MNRWMSNSRENENEGGTNADHLFKDVTVHNGSLHCSSLLFSQTSTISALCSISIQLNWWLCAHVKRLLEGELTHMCSTDMRDCLRERNTEYHVLIRSVVLRKRRKTIP